MKIPRRPESETGTFTLSGDKITFKLPSGMVTATGTISGTNMTITAEDGVNGLKKN